MILIAWSALGLALLPLLLGLWNLVLFRAPPVARSAPVSGVSVLIPARNEEANIGDAVRSVLASRDIELEVVVLDDHSTDATATIVRELAASDPRVRLEMAPPLPAGWSGKQHACRVLADRARFDHLLFLDADVRLAPGAVGRIAGTLGTREIALTSGFPREVTDSLAEHLVIPWIHVLLLGYLPMAFMRLLPTAVGFGTGCGQLMLARRQAYMAAEGHAAIRASLHDGVKLPRAFRRAGFGTDLFDATDLATCRMYRGWKEVWPGFSKNATEGMATPVALPVWTALIGGGHVLPWLLAPIGWAAGSGTVALLGLGGIAANVAWRALLAWRFRQSWTGALLHPVGALVLLAIQWTALLRRGRPAEWRGRRYSAV
ncbi:glycosyltransferase [Rhodocista pekingensis]|uniref:Glycosyltransferase n=1 Tax=Rhodocista pekingensis TaxID=201185 RepID=A0ABW2KYW6_9PROT